MPIYLAAIIEVFILYVIYLNISKTKFHAMEAVVVIFVGTLSILTIFHLIPNADVVMATVRFVLALTMISLAVIKTKNLPLGTFYAILTCTIPLLVGNLLSIPTIILLQLVFETVDRDIVLNDAMLYIPYISLTSAIGFVLSRITGNFLHDRMNLLDEKMKNKLATNLLTGASFVLLNFLTYASFHHIVQDPIVLLYVYTVSLIACFVLLVFSIFAFSDSLLKDNVIRLKNEQLENLQLYTESIEATSDEVRQFRHDHKNLLLGFHDHIKGKDLAKIELYFMQYAAEFDKAIMALDSELDRLKNIKVPELKSILSHKLLFAQTRKISVHIEVPDTIEGVGDNLIDVCRIAGILVDNAIEASLSSSTPIVRFMALSREKDVLFVIVNTCSEPPPISKMYEKNFTTKRGKRGMGLYTVSLLLEKNSNLSLATKIDMGGPLGDFYQEFAVIKN